MAHFRQGRNVLRQLLQKPSRLDHPLQPPPLLYASQGLRFRKLEVILTTNVEKLGKAGETVKVAPGHFRNHLMPKMLAVPNIDKFARLVKDQRKIFQREEKEEVKVVKDAGYDAMKEYQTAANRLQNSVLTIRTGVDAQKFRARETKDDPIVIHSSITKDDIVREVARQLNVEIDPDNLHLPSPLTTFGVFDVPLRLPRSIPLPEGKLQWTLKVKVRGR